MDVRHWLTVDGALYRLEVLDPDPSIALFAWRLTKTDGESYDIALTEFSWECSCPDWIARRQEKGELCKHQRWLKDARLLWDRV
jgi:hypothetical protein